MFTDVQGQRAFYSNGNGGPLDAARPSVAFIHGGGMEHSVWTLPARYFARHGYNVFAFDLPGHGRSAGKPLTSIGAMADWVKAALDGLGVERAALVGHSMGSLTALSFAARYPDRTRALALLGTSTPMPVAGTLLDAAKADQHDAIDMINAWSYSRLGRMGGNENPGLNMMMGGQRLLEGAAKGVLFADLRACNDFADGEALAAQVRAPTLVIVGDQDRMTAPIKALKLAELIAGARIVRLSPCGHDIMAEQPNETLDALAAIV